MLGWLVNILNRNNTKQAPLTGEQRDLLMQYTMALFQATTEPGPDKENPTAEADRLRKLLIEKGVPPEMLNKAQHDASNFGTPGTGGGRNSRY